MRIVNLWFKILCLRWGRVVVAAGLIILFGYGPSWSHGTRYGQPSVLIPAPETIDSAFAGYELLSKKSKKWKDLSPEERNQLRKKYKEWQSLPPEEKEKMRQRMNRLNRMSPQERKYYEQLHKKWRHLPPHERRQLQKELDNWENLSPREQEAIRQRFMR